MNISILYKTILLSIIPILALSIFSYTYFTHSHSIIKHEKNELTLFNMINATRELLYHLQRERGLSVAYASDSNIAKDKVNLIAYINESDIHIRNFQNAIKSLNQNELLPSVKKQIKHIQTILKKSTSFRESIQNNKLNADEVIELYSNFNDNLISLIIVTNIQSHSKKLNFDIKSLFMLIQYQEYAGKERAVVANILNLKNLNSEDIKLFYDISSLQRAQEFKLHTIHEELEISKELNKIKQTYSSNSYNEILKNIEHPQKISAKQWIKISTQRINEIHKVQTKIFIDISNNLNTEIETLDNTFTTQLTITTTSILLLILISFIVSSKINRSIKLEIQNASLVKTVNEQTKELQKQIINLTKARDKAIQAEIAKDEFLANMSHEIRTPLNAILGFVQILRKKIKVEENIGYLDIIHNSGNSLLTIINDILDFSKIQSGKFNISKYPVNPVDEFSNTALLFASKAYEKNIVYAVYIDPKMPKSLELDGTRVTQVISNLLSNAIKFTPEDGEIKVKVVFNKEELVISIQDNGIGISKENQAKVFSAFEQADGSTTRKYGGTGLGLSISSKLAALMNGKLTLTSEENKGSTFTLSIPTKVLDAKAQEFLDTQNSNICNVAILDNSIGSSAYGKLIKKYLQDFGMNKITEITQFQEGYDLIFFVPDDDYNEEIVNAKIPAVAMLRSNTIKLGDFEHIEALYAPFVPKSIVESISNMKIKQTPQNDEEIEVSFKGNILVAEDNKTNQMLISFLLDDYGLDFTMANDGVEAVKLFKEASYDLVLMDENMPNLNGIGAMQQIKAYEKENSLVLTPIIALTASVLKSDKEMFTDAGMDGFVGKPIDNKELEEELSKYLKKV